MEKSWISMPYYMMDAAFPAHIDRIYRVMRAHFKDTAARAGLSTSQLELLLVIATTDLNTAGTIAKRIGVSRSLLSKTVEELVNEDFLEKVPDEHDRRVVHLHLKPRAEEIAAQCCAVRSAFYREICSGIDKNDLKIAMRVIQQSWENINAMAQRMDADMRSGEQTEKGDGE
ncbi:MAG: MarR family winged helix-turn-helix transcriptional regulator [Hominenteromicrobium sp.]